jgi:hypothetical protein
LSARKDWQVLSSNDKGNIAEMAIALEAAKAGIEVLRPIAEHGRYDLVLDVGSRLLRVQCKWGSLNRRLGVISVRIGGSRHTPAGYGRSTYSRDEVDAIAVYCSELEEVSSCRSRWLKDEAPYASESIRPRTVSKPALTLPAHTDSGL